MRSGFRLRLTGIVSGPYFTVVCVFDCNSICHVCLCVWISTHTRTFFNDVAFGAGLALQLVPLLCSCASLIPFQPGHLFVSFMIPSHSLCASTLRASTPSIVSDMSHGLNVMSGVLVGLGNRHVSQGIRMCWCPFNCTRSIGKTSICDQTPVTPIKMARVLRRLKNGSPMSRESISKQ